MAGTASHRQSVSSRKQRGQQRYSAYLSTSRTLSFIEWLKETASIEADPYEQCFTCAGSGEGRWDGSRCTACRGFGEVRRRLPQ